MNAAAAPVVLNYRTLNYSVTPSDGVIWAYIHAYYVDAKGDVLDGDGDQVLASGQPVLEGAKIASRHCFQLYQFGF